jgi:CheY-like chemotaxis protein
MAAKKKIMIVEDQFFLAEMIRTRLEFLGYETVYAEHGARALELLQKEPVDLVIMDVMMPVMDGIEATKRIRADRALKDIPIIFLTARARSEDRQQAMDAGATDYIAKPFESSQLTAMIEKWIKK